jgi:hypothetical protein
LVADRQGNQDAAIWGIAQRALEAFAYGLPEALNQIVRPHDQGIDADVAFGLADVTGRPEAAFEQPGLEIEAVRIQAAMGALQAYGQAPALTCPQGWRRLHFIVCLGSPTTIPGQGNARRQGGRCMLDGELESHAALEGLRQAGHDAEHLEIAAFAAFRQSIGQSMLRTPPARAAAMRPSRAGTPAQVCLSCFPHYAGAMITAGLAFRFPEFRGEAHDAVATALLCRV